MNKIKYLLLVLLLASCASNDKEEKPTEPKQLFDSGIELIKKNKLQNATTQFELLEREHPASELAAEAKIRKAYAFYLDGNFVQSVYTVDEFVKHHPSHPKVAYMYYLKAICYFDQIVDVGRDQNLTYQAIDAFNDLIRRFPTSVYSNDAKLKLEYAVNSLAGKEMDIGRFYLTQRNLIAALNRFKNVINRFETSIFITEALYRVAEIHYALGDIDQAKKYASILGYNYPNDDWYKKAYALINDDDYIEATPWYKKQLITDGKAKRNRDGHLILAEILTILIAYHQSGMSCFKYFYLSRFSFHQGLTSWEV